MTQTLTLGVDGVKGYLQPRDTFLLDAVLLLEAVYCSTEVLPDDRASL